MKWWNDPGGGTRVLAAAESFEIAKGFWCSPALRRTLQSQQLHGQPAQLHGTEQHAQFTIDWIHVFSIDYQVRWNNKSIIQ